MSKSGTYRLRLELLAYEGINGNPINPEKDVPYVTLYETHETLTRLFERHVRTESGQNGGERSK